MKEISIDYLVAWNQRAALMAQLFGSTFPGGQFHPADPSMICDEVHTLKSRAVPKGHSGIIVRARWREFVPTPSSVAE